jgi:hypothetical protein
MGDSQRLRGVNLKILGHGAKSGGILLEIRPFEKTRSLIRWVLARFRVVQVCDAGFFTTQK